MNRPVTESPAAPNAIRFDHWNGGAGGALPPDILLNWRSTGPGIRVADTEGAELVTVDCGPGHEVVGHVWRVESAAGVLAEGVCGNDLDAMRAAESAARKLGIVAEG